MKSRTATLALTALLAATLPLSACSGSRYPARQTEVTYYPQCYQPIDRLRQDEQLTNNTTVGGAVLQSSAVERLDMLHSDFPPK